MPSPSFLQIGLGALLENPAIVEFAARVGEKAFSIAKAHFTFTAHEVTQAFQDSFAETLKAISDELAEKSSVQKLRQDFKGQFADAIKSAHQGNIQPDALKSFIKQKHQLFQVDKITEADLVALFQAQNTAPLTDLILTQMQTIAPVNEPLAAFLRHDNLLGQAVLFFLREKFRAEDRFEKTVAALQREAILLNQQRMMALMERLQLSTQVKARDEFTQCDQTTRQDIQQTAHHLPYLSNQSRDYTQLTLMVGSAISSIGDLAQAETLFTHIIEHHQNEDEQALAYFNRFQVRLRRKAYEEALADLQAAIAIDAQYMLHNINKYPMERILGAGGMGCVFLCQNPYLNQTQDKRVVVKCFWETLKGPIGEVFKEPFAMHEIAGDYVPKPLDFGYVNDAKQERAYFVTEYIENAIDGEAWLAKHGKMDLATGLQVGLQIAKGLQIAHEAGIYHLDLKPANILLYSQSQGKMDLLVKIIDFGLAKITTPLEQYAAPRQTRSAHSQLAQQVFGTFDYASPEQWGEIPNAKPGAKSDIFAFGATLYHLWTGNNPRYFRERDLPDNDALCDLLFECIQHDPTQRPESALQLFERFSQIQPATQTTTPSQEIEPPKPPEFAKNNQEIPVKHVRNKESTIKTEIPKPKKLKRLSSLNPLDWLRLLWWSLVMPQQLKSYRKKFGEKDEKRVGKWLVSILIWLPFLMPTLALGLELLPPFADKFEEWLEEWFREYVWIVLAIGLLLTVAPQPKPGPGAAIVPILLTVHVPTYIPFLWFIMIGVELNAIINVAIYLAFIVALGVGFFFQIYEELLEMFLMFYVLFMLGPIVFTGLVNGEVLMRRVVNGEFVVVVVGMVVIGFAMLFIAKKNTENRFVGIFLLSLLALTHIFLIYYCFLGGWRWFV